MWFKLIGRKLFRSIDNRIECLAVMIGIAFARNQVFDLEYLIKEKIKITAVNELVHGFSLVFFWRVDFSLTEVRGQGSGIGGQAAGVGLRDREP